MNGRPAFCLLSTRRDGTVPPRSCGRRRFARDFAINVVIKMSPTKTPASVRLVTVLS